MFYVSVLEAALSLTRNGYNALLANLAEDGAYLRAVAREGQTWLLMKSRLRSGILALKSKCPRIAAHREWTSSKAAGYVSEHIEPCVPWSFILALS